MRRLWRRVSPPPFPSLPPFALRLMERMGVTRRAEQAVSVPGAETKRSGSSLEGEKCLERRREFVSLMVTYSHARDGCKCRESKHLKGPVYHIKMAEKLLVFLCLVSPKLLPWSSGQHRHTVLVRLLCCSCLVRVGKSTFLMKNPLPKSSL